MTATEIRPAEGFTPDDRATESPADERVNWRSSIPFIGLAPPAAARDLHRASRATAVVLFVGHVPRPHVPHHRRLPPVLRAPQLPARRASRSSCMAFGGTTAAQKGPLWWAGHHRVHHRVRRHRRRPPLARSAASGGATSAGSCATSTARPSIDEIKDFAKYPGAAVPQQARLDRPVVARRRVLPHRRMERPRRRVLRVDDPVVAHDVPRELARARLRPPCRTTRPTRAGTRC